MTRALFCAGYVAGTILRGLLDGIAYIIDRLDITQ